MQGRFGPAIVLRVIILRDLDWIAVSQPCQMFDQQRMFDRARMVVVDFFAFGKTQLVPLAIVAIFIQDRYVLMGSCFPQTLVKLICEQTFAGARGASDSDDGRFV